MRKLRSHKGFTLIELMIVVVIIGILAALAVPRYLAAAAKSKQSEAKSILKQIYVNQCTYRQQSTTNEYFDPGGVASAGNPQALAEIWIEIMPSARYEYQVAVSGLSFTATATANIDDDAAVDTWMIDESGVLQCTVNDVTT